MNEDRMAGAARDWVGKAEHGMGDTVGSRKLKSDGLVDQATGTIQHGYGVVKNAVAGAVDDAPSALQGHSIVVVSWVAKVTKPCASGSATMARSTSLLAQLRCSRLAPLR